MIPQPLDDSGTATGAFWRLWPPAPLLWNPKRTQGRVSASTPLYVQSVVEHRGHGAPHGKPLVMALDDSAESTDGPLAGR
jgi:hypothetical protein